MSAVFGRDACGVFLPEMIETSLNTIKKCSHRSKKICMYASGISAVACEIVSNYADESSPVPVTVFSKNIPGWLTDEFTVIFVAYNEDKSEIREVYESIKAMGCNIIAITKEYVKDIFKDESTFIEIPSDLSPINAIGYIVGGIASMLQNMGTCSMKDDLMDMIGTLKKYRDEMPDRSTEAIKCISGIAGNVVAIYSPSNITASALWWKHIMKEKLGSVAFIGTMPEFNHNELVGWSKTDTSHRKPSMIIIHDRHATESMMNMMDAMRSVLHESGTDVCAIPTCGKNTTEKNLRSMMLGDHISRSVECISISDSQPESNETERPNDVELEINDPFDSKGQIFRTVDDLENALKCKLDEISECANILLCGMGGSGISNDVIRDYSSSVSNKFIYVLKFPSVPKWVDESTLAIISSYSGETQETLEIYDEVTKRGCKIIVMTSGGKLERRAKERNDTTILLKKGIQPRHAVGLMVGHLACIMEATGEPVVKNNIQNALPSLKEYRDTLSEYSDKNPAMEIARRISDKIPVVYSNGSSESIVLRWKSQISENSKKIAFADESSRSEGKHGNTLDEKHLVPIILLISSDNGDMIAEISELDVNGTVEFIDAGGETLIERMIRLIMLGDYVSLYLAYIKGVDPTDVAPIRDLKRKLDTDNNS